MTESSSSQNTVLETILGWSINRPLWQRDALRRIVAKGRLDVNDISELVGLCKKARGGKDTGLEADPLTATHLPANPGEGASVSLVSVADVEGVNNLAAGQTLLFNEHGITVIYGDNGAGKSGYARILKRACRARHAGKIERNIYAQEPPPSPSATIVYSIGGVPQSPDKWQDSNRPHPILSAVSVFDSDCASIHIKEQNEVGFRPFGLDVPDELAATCQAVKDALTTEQRQLEKARNPIFSTPTWKESTAVGKALASLKHDSDLAELEALANLTEDETHRLRRLREDLSKDPAKAAAQQKLRADNIQRLGTAVALIESKTSDKALADVSSAVGKAKVKREAARLAAAKAFSGEPLDGVGGEVWRILWDAARRYSTETAYPGQPFPPAQDNARCLLCQQVLSAKARERMARFEEFIQEDTERQAQEAESDAAVACRDLQSLKIETRSLKGNLQEVLIQTPDLARQTRRFLAAARARRYALVKSLYDGNVLLPASAPSPSADLAEVEKTIRDYATELQKLASTDERKKLEAELEELTDRELLGGMIETVRDETARLQSIYFLQECLSDTTTNTITKLGNDIADSVITPRLRDRFQEEIVRLAAEKVRVEIVRSGGKYGAPQYQVRLFAKPDAKVEDILSEGESTCVALAAFLTELATATHHSALVFDDPVSSLDHRWRKQVAKRLVDEAEHRQVIVFTHDLVFVNDIHDIALGEKRPMDFLTVSRGPSGTGTVTEGLPWKAQSVEDRIDKLEKAARTAKSLHDNDQEEEYGKEAAHIYDNLRASWERALEDIALSRVIQRHRDYIDTKHIKKVTVLTQADCDVFKIGFQKCCNVVDAHDPSAGRNATSPPPQEILKDIQALKEWVSDLRLRQKQIA